MRFKITTSGIEFISPLEDGRNFFIWREEFDEVKLAMERSQEFYKKDQELQKEYG